MFLSQISKFSLEDLFFFFVIFEKNTFLLVVNESLVMSNKQKEFRKPQYRRQ